MSDNQAPLSGDFEIEAGVVAHALMLAAEQPHHGFTVDDVERVEAYWVLLNMGLSWAGCIVSIDDGRRFEIIYDSGEEPEDEPEGSRPEKIDVRQMGATEGYSANQEPPWDDSVAELNEFLGLPSNPHSRCAPLGTRH